jgi:hypothetical protein
MLFLGGFIAGVVSTFTLLFVFFIGLGLGNLDRHK